MPSQIWQRLVGGFRSVLGSKPAPAGPQLTLVGAELVDAEPGPAPERAPLPVAPPDPAPAREVEDDAAAWVAAVGEALNRSFEWRARVLLEVSADRSQLGDGPAIVEALRDPEGGAIRQIPIAAQQALAVSRNPASSVGDLVKLFERDPTLTQSLLKTANSAWYRGRNDDIVISIAAAVQRIGFKAVENVLLSSIVGGMLCRPGGAYGALADKVWSHMLRTAPLAQRLAPTFGVDSESAYSLALLHDVGKLAVFDYISAARQRLHREVTMPEPFLLDLLVRLHEPIGGRAVLRWGLGVPAARALAEHHRHPVPAAVDPITEVLYVAESVDLTVHVRHEPPDLERIWKAGAITADREEVQRRLEEESD
jgi:HD-like signal output (HDOD) protein